MKTKIYIALAVLLFMPIVCLELYAFSCATELISAKSDTEVIVGISLLSTLILINAYILYFIYSQFNNQKQNENN